TFSWTNMVANLGFDPGTGGNNFLGTGYNILNNLGWLGQATGFPEPASGGILKVGGEPVSVITGEFHVDSVDIILPGPFPMELRRNYSSQNTADSGLGFGWRLSW